MDLHQPLGDPDEPLHLLTGGEHGQRVQTGAARTIGPQVPTHSNSD